MAVTLSPADFKYVSDLIRARSGQVLEEGKAYLAASRLAVVAHRLGLPSEAEVVNRLRAGKDPALPQQVTEAMTVNETSFFRDVHPFETLRTIVLPELVKNRVGRRLKIWCAASSTGQEPYTIAMVVREHFPSLTEADVQILATDLSAEVLARARAGRFTQLEVNRGLPAMLLVKHFTRDGTDWVLKEAIRRMVTFTQMNLVSGHPGTTGFDVVFLRNVLIYFDVPTKQAILARVRTWLRPGGYLFLGGSETTWNLVDGFERLGGTSSNCYRLSG